MPRYKLSLCHTPIKPDLQLSDSVRSRTEEHKNHSHTLKLKNSEVIIIKAHNIKSMFCHLCCFQVVEGFFCFLCYPHLMAQIRLCWTTLAHRYSNRPFNSDLVETFKTNAFNASFNAFVLDRVIGPFGTCNGSLLVFLGWSTSSVLIDATILFDSFTHI